VPGLTVTVIAKNEASRIADALRSVQWADEIIVVDAESDDETVAIARQFTQRVVVRPWSGYGAQKNYAASLARNDWILSLDADERVTPELGDEIRRTLAAPRFLGYNIPRVTRHLDRWIRTTDWYPDLQLRLYDRRAAQWDLRRVHEAMMVAGPVGRLTNELHHLPYASLADHADTIDHYTTEAARQMFDDGRRAGLLQIAGHPPLAFIRNYVLKAGFRDGSAGFIISAMNAYYVFLKFAKRWELGNGAATGKPRPPRVPEVPELPEVPQVR